MARQQIHHHAVVARVEVLHNDEGHAVDRRKRVQEFPARLEPASRGADRDDGKTGAAADGGGLGYPARPLRPNDMLEASRHSATFLEEQRPTERAKIDSRIRERLRTISTSRTLLECGRKLRACVVSESFPAERLRSWSFLHRFSVRGNCGQKRSSESRVGVDV